jgi:hypothetical protein
MKLQGKLEVHQNKCHHRNAPDTKRQCVKATDQWAWGWSASQTPWSVDPTLQPIVGLLHGHALQEVVTRNLKLEVSGSRTWWSAGHVARPAGQQVGNPSLDPYKYPQPMKFKISHSSYSSPLVKVSV